ncbi:MULTISPECIES: hypothetical protein [unclassified Streptomyces]|uniref:hypothetical protein n=1 Tax=unclassified Streptomyces TaxID=2593676 RepID=UPI003808E104
MDRTRLALTAVAAVLALPLVTAAQHTRQTPYGDRFDSFSARPAGPVAVRIRGAAVEAYDRRTGARHWTYARRGSVPLALRRAPGHTFTLWADGMITDTGPGWVRWHRAVPGLGAWLTGRPGRASGVFQPLDPGARMLAVVTPERITAFRAADGDLRWLLSAREGCTFDPGHTAHSGGALLVAQPCRERGPGSRRPTAVDTFGPITPDRTPLGNELPGQRRTDGGGNRVARPS